MRTTAPPVIRLRRRPGTRAAGTRAAALAAAKQLPAEGKVPFTARDVWKTAEATSVPPPSWSQVRKAVTTKMTGRGAGSTAELVEVTPGRFRLRDDEPAWSLPLEPAAPSPELGPPRGDRAHLLFAAAVLASRDPDGPIRCADVHARLLELGFEYLRRAVTEMMGTMSGTLSGNRRVRLDFERVRAGIYRLRPAPWLGAMAGDEAGRGGAADAARGLKR